MLVLSRKVGERLVIGDNITVVVTRVAGNRVTLGIEAPNDVRVVRSELKTLNDANNVPSNQQETTENLTVPASRTPAIAIGRLAGFVPRVAK